MSSVRRRFASATHRELAASNRRSATTACSTTTGRRSSPIASIEPETRPGARRYGGCSSNTSSSPAQLDRPQLRRRGGQMLRATTAKLVVEHARSACRLGDRRQRHHESCVFTSDGGTARPRGTCCRCRPPTTRYHKGLAHVSARPLRSRHCWPTGPKRPRSTGRGARSPTRAPNGSCTLLRCVGPRGGPVGDSDQVSPMRLGVTA